MSENHFVNEPIVYLVDDDPQNCRVVTELLQSYGQPLRVFESPHEFLDSIDDHRPGCAVLNIQLPGLDGIKIHEQLLKCGHALPVVMLTSFADTSATVRSLRNGAVTVLDKPLRGNEFWESIQEALSRGVEEHRRHRHLSQLECRLKMLPPQDRAVLQLMLQGVKNRLIADQLDVSLRTVENRRRRIFDVMHANSVTQLTRMIVEYEHSLPPSTDSHNCWLQLPFERMVC